MSVQLRQVHAAKPRRRPGQPGLLADSNPNMRSLQDAAYEEIKRRIINLNLKPGEHVNVDALSTALGMGRTPVHTALKRLAVESMVSIIPRKGVIVRDISVHEVMEIVDVRLVNESYCVRLAAERASKEDIRELRTILDRGPDLIARQDLEGLMNLDRDFHEAISRIARNKVLADLLVGLHQRSLRFWFISLSNERHLREVQKQHREIYDRISAHDPKGASDAIVFHISAFRANISVSLL